ncbi:hypothetical protein H9W90_10750 [Polaribacter pectinis]|uniref:Uncharacterized protein n=1 Tax=Polaribacter pectinis TaxID=2738844 RepID=A0A7G9L7S6_9FLAO|nr:hypothetical protein [Polaribacter pectinis]QNM84675.1 hypothetical protein H9W90_10750 [Polaribacter pectinis]
MIQKIIIGILAGTLIGMFITSIFMLDETNIVELFLTKITATSIICGIFCGVYAHFSKSKLQVFLISILIGEIVFYSKYLITGHDFDPITMGAFTGAMLGGTFAIIRKLKQSLKVYKRLQKLRKRGFKY